MISRTTPQTAPRRAAAHLLVPALAALIIAAPLPRRADAADLRAIDALAAAYDRHAAAVTAFGSVDVRDAAAVARATRELRRLSGRALAEAWVAKLAQVGAANRQLQQGVLETVRDTGFSELVERLERGPSVAMTIPGAREAYADIVRFAEGELATHIGAVTSAGFERLAPDPVGVVVQIIVVIISIVHLVLFGGASISDRIRSLIGSVRDRAEDAVDAAEDAFEDVVDHVAACLEDAATGLDGCLADAHTPWEQAACDAAYVADTATCLAGR